MTLNHLRFDRMLSPNRHNGAIEKLSQLQEDLVSEALKRAVDDMGAAMAHQVREPLTSLLLYLHEIRQVASANGASASVNSILDLALGETERVCEIMERVGHTISAAENTKAAVARGHQAIVSWTGRSARSSDHVSPPLFDTSRQSLTPREQEVMALITSGSSNKEGGHRLGISTRTFEAHRAHLMSKLGAKNVADLVRMSLRESQ